MSSFICEHCGAVIEDTPFGYVTGCEHWPKESDDIDIEMVTYLNLLSELNPSHDH